MNTKIREMLAKSTYGISDEKYVYLKVKTLPSFSKHFFISQDKDEITVVTREGNIENLDVIEKNENLWRLVSLNLSIPFMAGTLAEVNSACAEKGLNNLVVSTYSKDYIIIKDSQIDEVKKVLSELGLKES